VRETHETHTIDSTASTNLLDTKLRYELYLPSIFNLSSVFGA